jgi:DNA-binding LacI/PurR family transcriptional regulator
MNQATDSARTPRVTISDVARQAGVSVTTVSHALNGRGQVDPATRQKVEEVARELGYTPNRHAQKLRGGGSSMIALMSSMPFAVAGGPSRLGFLMEVASVAAASALERGMAMVLVPPLETGQRSLDFLDIDGALLIEPSADDKLLKELVARGLPVVSIGKPGGDAFDQVPYVDLLSGQTVQMLLEHMQAQGARQIAMVLGAAGRNSYAQAELAYQTMVEAAGMEHIALRVDESKGEAGGRDAARMLLAAYPQIDALLVLVDVFAVGVVQYLQQTGLRVPQDIMLATRYDGIRARTSEPPLTAVDLHLDQVARLAIDLLFERMRRGSQRLVASSPMPELVVRASTR